MTTTDETMAEGGRPGAPPGRPPGWMRAARRYGPIVAVVALAAGAVVVFGGGDDGDGDGAAGGGDGGSVALDELIRLGPMTPQRADLEGVDVGDIDFGPHCDTERGTIALVSVHAPPCVEAFTGDNGGATSPEVTDDEVKVVYYQADPALDPLTAATVEGAGADVDPESAARTAQGYVDLYNMLFEMYGRTVTVDVYTGTGAGDDLADAQADAQAASLAIGALAGPGKATMAGDPALREQDRVYGLVHYDTPNGDHQGVYEQFVAALEEQGIELATDVEFTLDLARGHGLLARVDPGPQPG